MHPSRLLVECGAGPSGSGTVSTRTITSNVPATDSSTALSTMEEPAKDDISGAGDTSAEDNVLVKLICKDGKEVEASKKVLIDLSPVFETLLTNEWKEGHENRVSVNWDSELVKIIVSYPPLKDSNPNESYCETNQVRPGARLLDFLDFAAYYNSQDLFGRCCNTLTHNREYLLLLLSDSFFKIFQVANDNDAFGIVHECMTIFRMKIFDFILEPGFAEALHRFMERGTSDKGVYRLTKYIEKYKKMGTRPTGDPAMGNSPCSGCENCQALPPTMSVAANHVGI